MTQRVVALVPARAGSKRCIGKNTRLLAGQPLLAYAIATAQEAGIFSSIAVSSEDPETLALAEQYGALPIPRPVEYATDTSPDVDWVNHALELLGHHRGIGVTWFAILRPTSPFRRGAWVKSAWEYLQCFPFADSLRAMRPAAEHPGKMWRLGRATANPVLPFTGGGAPWHSMPTQELPPVYVQTAALEISRRKNLPDSISGEIVLPYRCLGDDPESLDINTEADFERAERLAAEHPEWLPPVHQRVAV